MDTTRADELKQLHGTLQRYAGWLDGDRTSMLVRANVRALGAAIDTSADPSALLQALDTNIVRLPSGDLRNLLRTAAGRMRRALTESRAECT